MAEEEGSGGHVDARGPGWKYDPACIHCVGGVDHGYHVHEHSTGSTVVHPRHYNMGGPLAPDGSAQFEVIKIIEDLGWGFAFCMGNALKYTLRAPHKGAEAEDLQKARWYLERAKRHRGSVRAVPYRRININEAAIAWGLMDNEAQLTEEQIGGTILRLPFVVGAIVMGNPFEALDNLNVYMVKFMPPSLSEG